jgi:hypothetical protein
MQAPHFDLPVGLVRRLQARVGLGRTPSLRQSLWGLGRERVSLHVAKTEACGFCDKEESHYLDALGDVSGFRGRSFVVPGEGADGWVTSVSDRARLEAH